MQFARGKIVDGKVVVEGTSFDEGADVIVLTRDADDQFELTSEQEDELLASIADIERGDFVDGETFLATLSRS